MQVSTVCAYIATSTGSRARPVPVFPTLIATPYHRLARTLLTLCIIASMLRDANGAPAKNGMWERWREDEQEWELGIGLETDSILTRAWRRLGWDTGGGGD